MAAAKIVESKSPMATSNLITSSPASSKRVRMSITVDYCAEIATAAKLLSEMSRLLQNPNAFEVNICECAKPAGEPFADGGASTEQ
jgi:hypothetical protein